MFSENCEYGIKASIYISHQLQKDERANMKAIDGDKRSKRYSLGLPQSDEQKTCPIHFQFKIIRDNLKIMMEATNIEGLASGLHMGLAF